MFYILRRNTNKVEVLLCLFVCLFSGTDEEELNRLAEAAVSGYSIIQKGTHIVAHRHSH